jgi:hypothetical protein
MTDWLSRSRTLDWKPEALHGITNFLGKIFTPKQVVNESS